MFKWIKRFFGLDYSDHTVKPDPVRPPVVDKGEILVPTNEPTRPVVEDKGTVVAPVKKPRKTPAKKAPKKK